MNSDKITDFTLHVRTELPSNISTTPAAQEISGVSFCSLLIRISCARTLGNNLIIRAFGAICLHRMNLREN